MKSIIKAYVIFICALLAAGWLDPFKDAVSAGNKAFRDKKYQEAKQKYDEAESYAPNEEARKRLAFNRGTAEYMAGSFEDAAASLGYGVQSEEPEVQKKSFFNMGNAYLKMGKKKEAFESYSSALKIDPDYMPAKQNIEYLQKEQKNEQNKQNKDKENKNGDESSENKENDGKKQNEDDKQQNAQNKNDAGSKAQISREQVKNMLDSMKNKPVQRTKEKNNGRPYLENDW